MRRRGRLVIGLHGWPMRNLDIDVFGCKRLAVDLDCIIGRLGDLVLWPAMNERALNLLKRIPVLGRGFLKLQGQGGRNG